MPVCKNNSLVLGRLAGMFGEKRFLKNKFFGPKGCRRGELRRVRSVLAKTSAGRDLTVLFCREQKSTKRVAPKGPNLRFAPSGLPHSRHAWWGRTHPCQSLHPAERRLLGSALRPRSYSQESAPQLTLGRLTIDAPPRRPSVRPGGSVCGTNGCWNEVFGERFTARMRFDRTDSSRRTTRAIILRLRRS